MYKNKLRTKKGILASALVFALCIPHILPVAAAPVTDVITEEAIHISTAEDLAGFAQSCTLDIWSVGKVFVLDCDIDLTGTDFTPIPTFGGLFLGQGHTISGLSLSGGSDNMALFRYIQEKGEICQLTVSGSADAQSTHSGLALLAGVNCGVIENCHVSGTVKGGKNTGGIAGTNEITGVISNCSASGSVTGSHLIGGIAGENLGSISGCQNHCSVNTLAEDNHIALSSIDINATLTDLLTTENAASVTDIGGIAGSNSGSLRACMNDGSVGYPHTGYNIGGIAGSQSGFIEGCINYGILNGRKDVGGIAGQMEPSSRLLFDEDTLQKLNREFNTLHDLLTKLDQDCGGSSAALTGQIDQLLDSVEGAQNAVDSILGTASEDFSSFSEPTDLATLPSPRPVSLDFLDALPTVSLSPSAAPGESASPTASPTGSPAASAAPTAEPAASATPTAEPAATPAPTEGTVLGVPDNGPEYHEETESFVPEPLSAPHRIQSGFLYEPDDAGDNSQGSPNDLPGDTPDSGDTTDTDTDPAPTPTTSPTATPTASPSPTPHLSWPDGWPAPSGDIDLGSFLDDIDREEVEKSINDAQENIYEDASGLLDSIQTRIRDRTSVIGSRFDSAKNMLGSSFSAIITDTRLLNSMLEGENQIILDDFQAIIDELNVITDLITAPDPADPGDILEDISDADQITDTNGKVMNSVNKGLINGDLNVGGIAGSLSRENNLDPENDLDLDQYDTTLNFRYQQRIVIRQCENLGKIEGKKDCVGGIAGEVLLGSIMECAGSGTVKTDGNRAGGIAGLCTSTIRSSSAKCTLSGKEKIGGIAGEGSTIQDCFSMVEIREGEDYLGSIAGITDSLAEVANCFFVEGCPAGIDGISYAGIAQPLPYEEFLALPGLPDIFRNIYLTFEADGHMVSTITLAYGESLDPAGFPDVPEKDGFTGKWEEFDATDITFDQTIEAQYSEYITTLESGLKDGVRPVLLVEGVFTPEDVLSVSETDAYPDDAPARAVCYKIHVTGAGASPYTFRLLIPQDMEKPQLERLDGDGHWASLPAERDGSYLVFTLDGPNAVVCCADRPSAFSPAMAILPAVLLAALTGGLTLFFFRRRKKQKKH